MDRSSPVLQSPSQRNLSISVQTSFLVDITNYARDTPFKSMLLSGELPVSGETAPLMELCATKQT